MICLGSPQAAPTKLESEAAQLRAVELFRRDFMTRFPGGIVVSELEYMGRTTAAPDAPGPLRLPGRPKLSRVLAALTADFRRWIKDRDYRKCDALGISGDATIGELLEVTTGDNAVSAITQIESKRQILHETVNRIHNLNVHWRATRWKPTAPPELFYPLPSEVDLRFLCYVPTQRLAAPPGVVLYEVHIITRPKQPVPVKIPDEVKERIGEEVKLHPIKPGGEEAWARAFLKANPAIKAILKGIALVAGVALAIVALILVFDLVPGDEVAVAAAALWLITIATSDDGGSGGTTKPPGL